MQSATRTTTLAPLRHGERLTQPEFHLRYEAHPDRTKFELIEGVVYMASPAHYPHGRYGYLLGRVLGDYEVATPGVEGVGELTTVLGDESEPQPDLVLRVLPSHGGRTRLVDNLMHGGPELVIQVAHTTLSLDLNARRRDNEEAGVLEYLVVDVGGQRLRWFDFVGGTEIPLRGGLMRSRAFPGLWIDVTALFAGDIPALDEAVCRGIATAAHARFVQRLERARQRLAPDA